MLQYVLIIEAATVHQIAAVEELVRSIYSVLETKAARASSF